MIVQNNPVPWVVLALVVMGGCILTGMLLGDVGPFNSETAAAKVQITQTQAAINSHATMSALEIAQIQQAPMVQQTVIVAQMTTIPLQQTATHIAEQDAVQAAQVGATQTAFVAEAQSGQVAAQATQTAIVKAQYLDGLASNATATAMAQGQVREQATGVASFAVVGVGMLTLCGWIVAHAVTQATHARAQATHARVQEKIAQTQFLAEQRRMVSLRASLQNHNGHKPSHPVPNSLMQNVGDVDKLPKAE